MTTIPPFIPQFADMLAGTDWDISLPESVSYDNEISSEPIEDPNTSFVRDHNRQAPVIIGFELEVSTLSSNKSVADGAERITEFYEKLLRLRDRQSVSVDAFIEVYTGIRRYENMAFRNISQTRDAGAPNVALFYIELEEFRAASRPKLTTLSYLLDANDGAIGKNGKRIVSDSHRMITESTADIKQFRRLDVTAYELGIISAGVF